MVEIFVYRDRHQKVEEGVGVDHLSELLKDESILVWVDMQTPTLDDDQILLDIFRFHPLTVEDCRANRHHPKVDEFPDYLYFIFHGVHTDITVERFNTVELDGYLGQNFVVTYHHEPLNSIDIVKQKMRSTQLIGEHGSSFLLHQIIDQLVDDYLPVVDDFDERIDKLEDRIFALKQPSNQILEEILGLKRSLLRLRRISSKELDTLYRISHGQFHLIEGPVLPFYRDIYDHLVRITDLAESYRDLINGSLDAYMSVVSNRLNEIMKVLTIFSAIMLPLTFLAGVYGMNFDNMPELHFRYGYYGVLFVMLVITILMLIFFWKRGWLGDNGNKNENDDT